MPERYVWIQRVSMAKNARVASIAGVLAIVLGLATVVVLGMTGVWRVNAGSLAAVLTTTAFLLFGLLTLSFTARVDAAGLTVRSYAGIPRVHIPRADIVAAEAVELTPVDMLGGTGWRVVTGGERGVVTREGEALRLIQRDGTTFTITVDDATTAAALLQKEEER